ILDGPPCRWYLSLLHRARDSMWFPQHHHRNVRRAIDWKLRTIRSEMPGMKT
ncbi:hypothetical protein SeMB42_g06513, partial [Synchytrium endobioticum]